MKIQFIAQGLPEGNSLPAGDKIHDALVASNYKSFAAFVAFVSVDGINQLRDGFEKFTKSGGEIRLYVGVDLHGTSKEALETLLEMKNIKTYVVYSPNRIVYHPKIYSFEGKDCNMVMVGSSNMTMSGLYQNIEASICLTCENDNEDDRSIISDIYDYYNSLLTGKSSSCQILTQELIDLLCDNKVVLTSKETREQNNTIKKQNKTAAENRDKLKDKFSSLKITSARKHTKRALVEQVYEEENDEKASVYEETVLIERYSMWIETRKMTGGSRNILDLSKKGVRKENGQSVKKPGSVEFFGISKDDVDKTKDIQIVYKSKIYYGNTIKHAPHNDNWRLQIKGEAKDGSKITYLTNPNLGIPGGLVGKILVFEKTTTKDRYVLHIYESDMLDQFKDMASDWACMGNNGRHYGYLN